MDIQSLIDLWGDIRRGYTKESKAIELAARRLDMTPRELISAHPEVRRIAGHEIAKWVPVERAAEVIANEVLAKTREKK